MLPIPVIAASVLTGDVMWSISESYTAVGHIGERYCLGVTPTQITRVVSNIKVLCLLIMLPILTTLSVITSWYGPGFHGHLTANGERYNQNGLTAAHKTLPFGTKLKVCFKRCAVVRVNDRGPYEYDREIDLSKGAADVIGLTSSGVGRVKVTRLN